MVDALARGMRIGFTLLKDQKDSPLSGHFGKAKWLGIFDSSTGEMQFVRNTGLNGRFVADCFDEAGCTHAVFTNIGAPALEHLKRYGIRAYRGEPDVPAPALAERVENGELPSA